MTNSTLFDLSGRTAIVTGGGNGIGKASCLMLSGAGANVVVLYFAAPISNRVSGQVLFVNGGGEQTLDR